MRLKIISLERMTFIERKVAPSPNHLLPNVSSLDVSFNSFGHSIHVDRTRIPCRKAEVFAVMLPNLEEIDLSHTTVPRDCIARFLFSWTLPLCMTCHLEFKNHHVRLFGSSLPRASTEVHLDNSHIVIIMEPIRREDVDERD
jgi:hypothetical protein